MLRAARAKVERWPCRAEGLIDVAVEMRRITLHVLERTIFSDGLGHDAEDIRKAMSVYFDTIGEVSPLDILGVPDFVPRLAQWRVRKTLRFFEGAIDRVIATRRALLAEHPERSPNDILTHLLNAVDADEGGLAMTEAEVRSNILTFFSAGHETTANALTWAMFLLSRSDEWQERVGREAEAALRGPEGDTASRLEVTRAVVEEAIRLYPPIAAISRVACGPDDLDEVRVRKGSLVVISPYVLHRHRRLWEDPDVFDPARFLGEARGRIDRFAYLPFGVGPRTCIGAAFALQEAVLTLAVIAARFRFGLTPDAQVWPLLRVTLRPASGPKMVVRRKPPATMGLRATG
jgi:cytochrome P450